jgi:hypothetical protein
VVAPAGPAVGAARILVKEEARCCRRF